MIFCDWLNVTYKPDADAPREFEDWALMSGFVLPRSVLVGHGEKKVFEPESQDYGGNITVEYRGDFARVSATGGALRYVREEGLLEDMLMVLGSSAHRVTRLDASMDRAQDGADVLALWRRKHRGDSTYKLSRKSVPIEYFTAVRADGRETGTVYIGSRKSRTRVRIYDKSWEQLQKYGRTLELPTTRYEIEFKDGQANLHDAARPEALFWSVAAKIDILEPPAIIPKRIDIDMAPEFPPRPKALFADFVKRGVETDPQLALMLDRALEVPHGLDYLLGVLRKRVEDVRLHRNSLTRGV